MDCKSVSIVASHLYQKIAYEIMKSPNNAKIEKDFVMSLHNQCKNSTSIKDILQDLINLFEDEDEIPIIGNTALNNDILTSLAAKLSSDISRANSKVVSAIQERSSEYQRPHPE